MKVKYKKGGLKHGKCQDKYIVTLNCEDVHALAHNEPETLIRLLHEITMVMPVE